MPDWRRKEKKDAEDFGGRRRPRSGGFFSVPGDVSTKQFLIDDKTTDKMSFSVTSKMWKKIYDEALKCRKLPCLSVQLGDKTEVVVLDKNDFLSFFEKEQHVK